MGKNQADLIGVEADRSIHSFWRGFLASLKSAPVGDAFSFSRLILIPLGLVAILTFLIRITGFDLALQKWIYSAGQQTWDLGKIPFWRFLYEFGAIPALITVVASVIGIFVGAYRESWRQWRRVFVFSVLLFALGPGVITNGILKEYWGRPRPREVQGLGGRNQFEPVLTFDKTSQGKSFPSGHATMGFYFVGGFFLLRRYRRRLAAAVMLGAIAFGGLVGIARMAQGGHFLSDVIWSFVVCYFSALALYYALGLHKGLHHREAKKRSIPIWQRILMALIGLGAIIAVTLATPYRATRNLYLLEEASKTLPLHFVATLTVGEHVVTDGVKFKISGEAYGHGVPTSSIAGVFREGKQQKDALVVYKERISGWFSEVNEQLKFEIPWNELASIKFETGEALVRFEIGSVPDELPIQIVSGEGDLTFVLQGRSIFIAANEGIQIEGGENLKRQSAGGGGVRLMVEDDFSGRILIED